MHSVAKLLSRRLLAVALVATLVATLFAATVSSAAELDITGAGSSAAHPLYRTWSERYSKSGGAALDYRPIGSSGGIKQIKERAIDFGASDVAMSRQELAKEKLICFPSAISGVVPVVNIAGVRSGELRLSGELLAAIFARKIVRWNDPALAALNPRLALPNQAIVLVVRLDGSGSTYNFTDYLSQVSPEWRQNYGRNFTIAWPAEVTQVKGSDNVVKALAQSAGAIGYVDYHYVVQNKLAAVKLRNRDGHFVAPGAAGFAAALTNSAWTSEARYEEMLTNKAGAATWPIAMGTFVLIPQTARNPERTVAALKFFVWGFLHGDAMVDGADFVRLPEKVQGRIYSEMTKISDAQGQPLRWSLGGLLASNP
jgi:phosphate transport system substrate-binding protein